MKKAKMAIRVTLATARADKSQVMDNVRQWRREHGLPAVGPSKREFDLDFNSLGQQLKGKATA